MSEYLAPIIIFMLGLASGISAIVIENRYKKRKVIIISAIFCMILLPIFTPIILYFAYKGKKQHEDKLEEELKFASNSYIPEEELSFKSVKQIVENYSKDNGEVSFNSRAVVLSVGADNMAQEHHRKFGGAYLLQRFKDELIKPSFTLSRSFSSLDTKEKCALMLIEVVRSFKSDPKLFNNDFMSIISNHGDCKVSDKNEDLTEKFTAEMNILLKEWMRNNLATPSEAVDNIEHVMRTYVNDNNGELSEIIKVHLGNLGVEGQPETIEAKA
ncbi:hypothetical protein LRP52_47440 [Photobacterium sp. ZSDE20]|uniref:Uncharacterized protein n=1 Tax=Photobacterium pectinilyticum TaxID=2906793 RepID=A0ABT1NAZ4_9GAMM|nr:hypothetical protein [Photobacterium sp. ZSDE20]MCQ1061287.1 hypothetical protein [Photobacterium sp. ZSDE20]MDD1829788.1 hypothetical protein [Photobacterium sp. ZSDE20]